MTTAATISARLILDKSDYDAGLKQAGSQADTFASKMKSIGGQMTKVGGMMTVGLTLPIVAFGASSIKSSMEAESALADLNAVLESTGGIAGVTLDELVKNSAALQKITKFSDEAIQASQGMLLTFTNIGKDIFPQATMATLDMAEKFGMDASQAAITLGKALNDPISGVTALRRIGVMLTDEQEQQIKKFMEVGDIASAQGIIMEELAKEIGGVAEAAGATSSGKMEQFKNQSDDMKEIVGTALIPVLIRLMEAITPLIEKFANASPATQNFILILAGIVAVAGPVITIIGGIVSAVGFLAPILTTVFTFISATAIPAIFAFIAANILWIAPLLLIIATLYLVYLAFKNNFGGITTTVQQLWFIIKWAFDNVMGKIGDVIKKVGEMVSAFLNAHLPDWLTPGSPTPFEMGLRGISSAMDELSGKNLPKLQAGFDMTGQSKGIDSNPMASTTANNMQGGSNIVINIENPKVETSEESIRKTLKNLSYLGVVPS